MLLRRLLPALLITSFASLAVLTYAANARHHGLAALSASVFSLAVAGSGLWLRQEFAGQQQSNPQQLTSVMKRDVLLQFTYLTTLTYGWCAAALFLCYPIAGLQWHHGWQYATGFLLATCGFARYLSRLNNDLDPLAKPSAVATAISLAALEGAAIVAILAWIVLSGKLTSVRNDWVANDIFVAGGMSVLCLSIILTVLNHQLSSTAK